MPIYDPDPAEAAVALYDSINWQTTGEPDVLLLLTRANAHLIASGAHTGHEELRRQLARLIHLRTEAEKGGWGWGLSYPWDAFGDEVDNPANTIYSYTTAAAALAFLDGYEMLGDQRYLAAAHRAADALLHDTCCWRSGNYLSVWYSNQPKDQHEERQVHNVNGLTLGVLSRLDKQSPTPRYGGERSSMSAHLVDEQGHGYSLEPVDGTEVSDANWRYMQGQDRPNDLIHETFIVEGLLAHGTDQASRAAEASLEGIWKVHFTDEGRPRDGNHTFGSLNWGPGAGLTVLAASPAYRVRAGKLARYVAGTVDGRGRSALADTSEVRAQAWYALGLARYARELRAHRRERGPGLPPASS